MTESSAPETKPLHREGLSRPETFFERLGYAASTWFGRIGVVVVILLFVFAIVVGVPAWVISGSDSYRAAQEFVIRSDAIGPEVGEVLAVDKFPLKYAVEKDRAEYHFGVKGSVMGGQASVTVTRGADGVWAVTSATFLSDVHHRGVHQKVDLLHPR